MEKNKHRTPGLMQGTRHYTQNKNKKIEWVGTCGEDARTPEGRLPKMMTTIQIGGKRRRGSPREWWMNQVEMDLK